MQHPRREAQSFRALTTDRPDDAVDSEQCHLRVVCDQASGPDRAELGKQEVTDSGSAHEGLDLDGGHELDGCSERIPDRPTEQAASNSGRIVDHEGTIAPCPDGALTDVGHFRGTSIGDRAPVTQRTPRCTSCRENCLRFRGTSGAFALQNVRFAWSRLGDLNPGPTHYECLPTVAR